VPVSVVDQRVTVSQSDLVPSVFELKVPPPVAATAK
jgi:hypothetical protein